MNLLQWNQLTRDFEAERCILMLGPRMPGLKKAEEWRSINEELSIYLTQYLDDGKVNYDKDAARDLAYIAQQFLSIKGARRVDLEDLAKDFLESNTKEIPEFYYQLAELPLHLIINTTPDDYMERALREKGKPCVTHHYNFRRECNQTIEANMITQERPLVYNLFGTMREAESLVMTDNNQLEFVRNVVKDDPRIPDEILGQFDHRKTYVFLGFDLENWQFRLLLDSLNLREENSTFSPRTPFYPLSEKTKEFFANRFNFVFDDSDLQDFVSKLNEKIKPKEVDRSADAKVKKVYIISDTDDEALRIELEKWLSQSIHNKEIELWYRNKFTAGTDNQEIMDFIKTCDCILPLLSPDLLANDTLWEGELKLAIDLSQRGTAVHPVLLRHCDWQSSVALRKLKILPENKNPVTDVSDWDSRDEAWLNIIKELKNHLG